MPDSRDGWADAAIVRAVLEGDEEAFRTLYRRHAGRLKMTVLRMFGNRRGDVDDVLQEAWLAVCRGLHQYRADAQFGTWLTAIAIRTAARRPGIRETLEADVPEAAPSLQPRIEQDLDLERALAQLSDAQRAVAVLHDIEGFTHYEISHILGIAEGTSRSALTRARRELRRLLGEEKPS
jgi:RNA polymerase sigma-70 factor (ECF subfamily)